MTTNVKLTNSDYNPNKNYVAVATTGPHTALVKIGPEIPVKFVGDPKVRGVTVTVHDGSLHVAATIDPPPPTGAWKVEIEIDAGAADAKQVHRLAGETLSAPINVNKAGNVYTFLLPIADAGVAATYIVRDGNGFWAPTLPFDLAAAIGEPIFFLEPPPDPPRPQQLRPSNKRLDFNTPDSNWWHC